MMMAGLALVAGTAMAVNEKQVLPGNTYSYSLTNIVLTEAATAEVDFVGDNSDNVTIYQAGTTTTFTDEAMSATADGTLKFDILYQTTADPSGVNDSIVVKITYNGDISSTCENSIALAIDILPPPTYTLAIAVDRTSTCQERTGRGDNLADARGGETGGDNIITFTVTPTIENIPTGADFTFTYNIYADLPSAINGISISPTVGTSTTPETKSTLVEDYTSGDYAVVQSYELSFNTTTGVDSEEIDAVLNEITTTATLVVNDGSTTQATIYATGTTTTASTTIFAVPTMGGFAN